ncbi:unnamed protein product, partial [Nippostrongylus brasiliensis]|uniref:SCP domain-containing protein n=1 Tax=Nippostrongylus brasiliensis TaxID=27835 RepID=A0A0N4XPD4_NIPBR
NDNNDYTCNNNHYYYTEDNNNNNYYYTEDNDHNDYTYNNDDNNYYNDKTYNNYNNDNYDNYDGRMNLAAGKIQKNNGNLLPQAADMLKLRYGCGLEKQAKQQAETCSGVGSNLLGTKENFHRVPTSEASTEMQALQIATRYWWKSVRLVPGIGMKVTFRAHHQNSRIRFFTLMGWHTLKRIGCYVARCNASFDVVCRYRPRFVF